MQGRLFAFSSPAFTGLRFGNLAVARCSLAQELQLEIDLSLSLNLVFVLLIVAGLLVLVLRASQAGQSPQS